MLEDEFDVDELMSSLICLRSWFRSSSFIVKNCWLGLLHLTNSPTIRWTFDLFLILGFLPPILLLPLRQIDEVRDDESDSLLSLDTTDEIISAKVVLWILPWGQHIIIFIGVFLLILVSNILSTSAFKTLSHGKEVPHIVTLTNISSSHTTTSSLEALEELHDR